MPYMRSRSSRYTRGNRGRKRKRRSTRVMTVGRVKRIISAELKISTVGNDFIKIDIATPMVVDLTSPIAQGDGATQRTGNWIQPVTYHGYATIRGTNNSSQITNKVRCMILRWKNDDSVDPAELAKVVFDPGDSTSSFNFDNKGSFTILWSRVFNISHADQNSQFLKTYRWKLSLGRGQKVLYADAAPKKFQLFFMAFSDSTVVAESPELAISSTLRWTDS